MNSMTTEVILSSIKTTHNEACNNAKVSLSVLSSDVNMAGNFQSVTTNWPSMETEIRNREHGTWNLELDTLNISERSRTLKK